MAGEQSGTFRDSGRGQGGKYHSDLSKVRGISGYKNDFSINARVVKIVVYIQYRV